jgi:hypothetical protein
MKRKLIKNTQKLIAAVGTPQNLKEITLIIWQNQPHPKS